MGDAVKFEVVEVTIRRFYHSDEADVEVKTTFDVTPTEETRDWGVLMEHMISRLPDQLDGAPLTNVQEMTLPEAEEYRRLHDNNGETP